MTSLIRYEAAKAALAEARAVDEILQVRNHAEQLKLYARQAKDLSLLADATEIRLRAERKLGVLLVNAKETGQLGIGRPSRSNLSPTTGSDEEETEENGSAPEQFSRVTLEEAGIDRKLSSRAQKWARLGDEDFDATLLDTRERILAGGAPVVSAKPNGERTVMASRVEPDDSLDYFPTPPWATRALIEDVLPHLGVSLDGMTARDPGCGEGHITGVLQEYPLLRVWGSDIFDYSRDGRSPPGWVGERDFLDDSQSFGGTDWYIMNSPFGDQSLPFVLRALWLASVGVAAFVRQQWLEGIERYEQLFSRQPPTLYAQFVERVNLCKGRWDPEGTTASAYCWLVWVKDMAPLPPLWIPPGRREARSRADDVARFTAHPVLPFGNSAGAEPPTLPADDGGGNPALPEPNTPEGSGTAREASGGQPLPGAGDIGGLQQGIQSAPHPTFKHTKATAEPILREKYGKVSQVDLAAELNVPLGTVQTWAYRLGLTKHERLSELAHALNNRARAKKGESQ